MDRAEAAKWYRMSAEQGIGTAQNNLGRCYTSGEGVVRNLTEAAKWYRMAAEQENSAGQFNLGWCFENGNGVVRDLTEATKWYRMSAASGFDPALQAIKRITGSADLPKTAAL
jgi:TPR repeat protein